MALPDIVYEKARESAANVVIATVTGVTLSPYARHLAPRADGDGPPPGEAGTAQVRTTVERVERGRRFKRGDEIVVHLPYATADATLPIGGDIWFDKDGLSKTERARIFPDEKGNLVMNQFRWLGEEEVAKAGGLGGLLTHLLGRR